MKKLFNVCLIVFVLFSQLASFPYNQVKAETLTGNSLFDTVEMKDTTNHIIDEALNPKNLIQVGSTIHLEYAWSIKDHQTDSTVLQIPKALKVKSDKQGNLMADQQIIGQYFVTANDNKMKLVFNDQVKDSKGANGKINFDTVFNPDLKPGAKSVQLSFPLGTTAKSISVPVQVDNPASPTTNKDTAQQPTEEQKNSDAQQPAVEKKNGDAQQPAEEKKNNDAEQPAVEHKNGDAQQPAEEKKNGDAEQPAVEKKNNDAQQPAEEKKNGDAEQPAVEKKNNDAQQPAEEKKNGDAEQPTENPGDKTTEQPVENPDPSPKQITENILTGVTLTDKDGKPFNNTDNRPNPNSITQIDFTWEILKSLNVKEGDYFTFQLPEYFIVHNTITQDLIDGKGHTIGSFVVTPDGKVTMTFNEYVDDYPNIAGHLNIRTEFNEVKITGTTEKQIPFPIKEKDVIIELDFKPKVTKSIDKKGVPDRPINTNQINWKVEMNKTKDKLTNAVFQDNIPNGASLNEDSIKVYYLEVDINGKTTRGAEVPKEEYELTSSSDKLNIAFKKETNKAYEIEYATKITDESVTTFKNNANVSSKNQKDVSANATVTVSRGTHLEKTSKYNPKTQTIEWTITYNGDQRKIKKEAALLKDILDKDHKIDQSSIVVKNASYNDSGQIGTGDDATNFTIKETTEGFALQFTTDIDSAYVITYTSKAAGDVIADGEIENEIIADGGSSKTNKVTLQQQNIIKKHNKNAKDTDYNAKTTKWTIIVNDNNYVLNDAVIKDTFDYGGLTLQKDSFKITDGSRTLDPNFDYTLDVTDKGFEVRLTGDYKSNMDKTLTITYTTDFNYENLSKEKNNKSFKNTAKLSWKDIGGKDKNSSSDDTFNPDGYTKGNGFKYGSYNAQTKEIKWDIGFNYNNMTIKDPSIVDVLRDNQKLIPESIEVRHMKLTGGAHGFEVSDPVPSSEYTIEAPTKDNNNTLTIHFKNEIKTAYHISFKTSLAGEQINERYDNYADLKDGSKTVTTIHGAFEITNGGSGVTKTAKQNDKHIDWSVSINASQSTIENAVVTDDPTDNQIIDEKSFHLYPTTVAENGTLTKDTANELKEGTDYKLKVITDNNTGKQQFKVEFLHTINRAYILEYRTLINADHNEKVSNKATITGHRLTLTKTEDVKFVNVKVSSGSGGGSATKGRGNLHIKKYDEADKEKKLSGAVFTLFDRTGTNVIRTITTDEKGIAQFNNLKRDEYLLRETEAPDGYVISKELRDGIIVKLDTEVNETKTYPLPNKKFVGKVILTKIDRYSKEKLEHAVFSLLDQNKQVIPEHKELTTNDKGQITVDNLKPGTYYLKETKAPEHYQLDDQLIEVKIAKDQTAVIEKEAKNNLITGSAILTKVDKNGETLAGAVFSVRDRNNKIIPGYGKLTTNDQGQIEAKDLRPGDYQFVEEKAPEHYDIDKKPIEFTIVKSQKKAVTVTATNHLIKGGVILTKTDDIDNKTTLAGAIFKIVDANDEKKVIRENVKTGADGKAIATGLRPGDYKFIEVTAPKYYDKNTNPIKFTITESQTTSATVTAKNSLTKGGIELTKVNAADEKETLEGAVFKIVNRDTNEDVRTELVTNSKGILVVDDLRPGNYKLIETKAPTYYDVNVEPIEFTIEKGQQKLLPLTFKNSLTKGKVKLIKEDDVDSKIALAGAVFKLQDATGTDIMKDLKTDDYGVLVIPDLAPGDYQFIETEAPEHYKLDQTPIKFTIKKGSTEDLPIPVTVKNSLLTGGVTLTKVDDVDGITLEGAEFIIVDAHDTKKVVRKGLTTDEHGKVSASDLRPGDYQFIEVKAPKDYDLSKNPIPFTIGKSQQENITVTATNSLTKGGVILTKIDDIDRTMLKDAVFKIVDMKGNEVRTNLVTNDNGEISVSNLRPGDYQFIETAAPEHYMLDETPIPFTIERSQTEKITVTGKNTLKKGSVELTKIDDIDTDTKLANAVFNLLDADGEIVEEGLKTNAEGKIVVENLRPGTYKFIETAAPEHYDLNKKTIEFTIKKSQTETLHVTAKNALTKGAVELSKVDDIDDTTLEGAVFNIVDMNGTVIHKDLVTNGKGKIEINDLRPGDYQFIETEAPKHYVLDETPINFTIEKGQKKTISLTAKNSLKQGSIELIKVDDLNDQTKLADAVFNLLDQNGKVLKTDLKTNSEGKIIVENLRPGTYQFVETTAPKHYDLDKKPIVVTVKKSQKDIATVTMKNSLTKGGVELTKVDDVDGTTLEGAVFNIVDMNGTVIRKNLTTNSQGKISVSNLRPGDYQFIETKAPKHYDLNKEPIPFTIEKGQAEPISVTAKNSLTKGAVELSKVDDIDGTALEGAVFKIVDDKNNDVRTDLTTVKDGKISVPDLRPGDYQFIEIKAPEHYKLDSTPLKFTIKKSQAEKLQVTATNSLIEGTVELIKVDDINPDTKLSDAVFNIIDAKGKVVRTNLTTDKDGKVSASNLRPGDYQFVETKAPKNYDLNKTPIPFTIEKSQPAHVSVTAKNGLTKGGVELTKVDSLDAKETLEGAVFKITDMNGNDIRTNLVTNKDGKIIAKDLQPGDYQFIETKAPKHYDLNEEPIKFTIERSQTKHVFVTATNSLTKGSVELIKVDDVEENTTLEGAVFKIVNKDGHDVRTDLTTDKNGRLVVDELPPGDYEFIETKAPNHYDLNETPIKFTVKKGQEKIASVTTTNSLMKGAVELSKVDDVDGSVLKDAVFKIVDMNGHNVRSDLTTDKDGKISVSDLRPGDYQFVETKAPIGYDLSAKPIPFTITKGQSQVTSVTALNSLTTGSMELTKIDIDHHGTLAGALFNILDHDGKVVREGLQTDGHGKLIVNDLKPGNYQLVETKAPKGYQLDASPINFTIEKAQAAPLQVTVSNKKIDSSSGGDDKPITPPNKEEETGKETSEELEKGNPDTHGKGTSEELEKENPDTQINKQQDDRNKGKELPNTGHKNDPSQTVGIVLLLAGLLSILATKRKKYY
ncbi:Ig-like domain-containing protein [Bacillus wiedmannii]|uniref:SpaA isopeptide-forming pilin-related protein n=2 Tax=Bacillus wiedmannii TaxID=1890302 RepID=UPI001E57126E|nr:SpaA isopeptide-forming pilin-related protein [Bacillus wiedmannii]MCC2378732.1 Ig-like domain-containing protein [Bacillus wiedmannii]